MIAVLDVLHVELPVARQRLAVAAEQLHRRAHHAADAGHDLVAEILLERRRVGRERAEDETAERREPQLARPMVLGAAVRRHAALAAEALAERDAGEIAAEIVAPVVVDADDVARLAALVEHEQRAAMSAAVLEGVELAVLVARHDDRHGAEVGAAIAVGPRQLGFEAEKIPGGAAKDARLLLVVDVAVRVDPIGHPREAFSGPVSRLGCNGHLRSFSLGTKRASPPR